MNVVSPLEKKTKCSHEFMRTIILYSLLLYRVANYFYLLTVKQLLQQIRKYPFASCCGGK